MAVNSGRRLEVFAVFGYVTTRGGQMRFSNGALEVVRLGGLPVRLHWSLPLGLVVFDGFAFNPQRLGLLLALFVVHSAGHLAIVKAVGAQPVALVISGVGGCCLWEGSPTSMSRICIAWGGVWAQTLVLLALGPLVHADSVVASVVVGRNVAMMLVNLIPLVPFDGAEAWVLPLLLGRRLRDRVRRRATLPHPTLVADLAFDAGERSEEVSAMVVSLLEGAKREER